MIKKIILLMIFSIIISGCSTKKEVYVGSEKYIAIAQYSNKESIEKSKKIQTNTGLFNYPAIYIASTELAYEQAKNNILNDKKNNDSHLEAAKIAGATMIYNKAKGISPSSLGIGFMLTNLALTDLSDTVIAMIINDAYETTINGSIRIVKIWNGKDVIDSFALGFDEIKYIRDNICGYKPYPNAGKKIRYEPNLSAGISGKCTKFENSRTGFATQNIDYIKALKAINKEGSIFTYTIGNKRKTAKMIDDIKTNIPKGWYVMYADSLRNEQTGEFVNMYRVWKDGEEWAYPLPEKPVLK